MKLTLPYEFDSTVTVARILRFVLGLAGVIVLPGVPYTLLVTHNKAGAALLVVVGVMLLVFARIVAVQLGASRGVISESEVTLRPFSVFGMPMGMSARMPFDRFEAVRVERISARVDTPNTGPHERVLLVGRSGTADILVARTSDGEGVALGRELAAAMAFPCSIEDAPY